jgi:hypothetical protein
MTWTYPQDVTCVFAGVSVAAADESPVAAKLKKLWLKAPTSDETELIPSSVGKLQYTQNQ